MDLGLFLTLSLLRVDPIQMPPSKILVKLRPPPRVREECYDFTGVGDVQELMEMNREELLQKGLVFAERAITDFFAEDDRDTSQIPTFMASTWCMLLVLSLALRFALKMPQH